MLDQFVGGSTGAGKDEHRIRIRLQVAQQVGEQGRLHTALHMIQRMAHRLCRDSGIHLNAHGITQRLLYEDVELLCKGGGEEHGLPFGR